MARHETDFEAAAEAALGEDEIALVADGAMPADGGERAALLARFLTNSEGFAAAARALGGSFAGIGAVKRR